MSDTPRTDERITSNVGNAAGCAKSWVPAEFARQLERELRAKDEEIARLNAKATEMALKAEDMQFLAAENIDRTDAAKARVRELEDALRDIASVDPVDAALDPQRAARIAASVIANPLGGPASMFETIARRLRQGEDYAAVLADYGLECEESKG